MYDTFSYSLACDDVNFLSIAQPQNRCIPFLGVGLSNSDQPSQLQLSRNLYALVS